MALAFVACLAHQPATASPTATSASDDRTGNRPTYGGLVSVKEVTSLDRVPGRRHGCVAAGGAGAGSPTACRPTA